MKCLSKDTDFNLDKIIFEVILLPNFSSLNLERRRQIKLSCMLYIETLILNYYAFIIFSLPDLSKSLFVL